MTNKKKPELLVPASSLEVLKTAVIFGADAVYIGGEAFGLRAKAKNFSMEEMAEGIAFAHTYGVKVYVTANILAHNDDLEGARVYFEELRDMKPEPCDALIISDPGMYSIAREVWEEAEIHISTQANNTNYGTYLFWWKLGAKRVVSARELSLQEIQTIREHIPPEMEIESFVHGAMCISYSGRCLLSNFLTGRDANQGSCTHPCRWKYAVVEETRPGEYMPVLENERGTYIFNSRDLCMIEHIPELVEAGIDSFKIEGRMKTALYVATVARTYRKAIDDYFADEELYRKNMDWYKAEIAKCTHRRYTTGFYFGEPQARHGSSQARLGNTTAHHGKPADELQIYDDSTYINEYTYLGTVEDIKSAGELGFAQNGGLGQCAPAQDGGAEIRLARIEQRNKFAVGDTIELMKPDGRNTPVIVEAMYNAEGEPVESCPHAKQVLWIELSGQADDENATVELHDVLRVKEKKIYGAEGSQAVGTDSKLKEKKNPK